MTDLLYPDRRLPPPCRRPGRRRPRRCLRAVALDRTAFYPTGGGQPHDAGVLAGLPVIDVGKDGDLVWHTLSVAGGQVLPQVPGDETAR